MTISSLLWLVSLGAAEECNVRALKKEVNQATPAHTAPRFAALAACDADAAASVAKTAVPRFLAGPEANEGVAAAIQIGAGDLVREWLQGIQMGERATTIEWLGNQCKDTPEIEGFFVAAQEADNETFFQQRWYRGLSDCRTEAIQALLADALQEQRSDTDRTRFRALVGIYARNLGADALPTLSGLLAEVPEAERRLMVEAFADAADVGNEEGMDEEAAVAAVAALLESAEHIPGEAVDTLRNTLRSLGDEAAAESSVRYRWPDRIAGGSYRYLAAVHELWTCKNGKEYGTLHYGEILEPTSRWPDTLSQEILAQLTTPWELGRSADKCKGEASLQASIVDEPLADDTDASDWIEAERQAFLQKTASFKKITEAEEPALQLPEHGP